MKIQEEITETHNGQQLQRIRCTCKEKRQFIVLDFWGTIMLGLMIVAVLISLIFWCGVLHFWKENIHSTTERNPTTSTINFAEPVSSTFTTPTSNSVMTSTESTVTQESTKPTENDVIVTTTEHVGSSSLSSELDPYEILLEEVHEVNGHVYSQVTDCIYHQNNGIKKSGHNVTLILTNINGQRRRNEGLGVSVSVFVVLDNQEMGKFQASYIALKIHFLNEEELQVISERMHWKDYYSEGLSNFNCSAK